MGNLPAFIKKGSEALDRRRDSPYVALKDGDMVDVIPLTGVDDVISFDQHAIWLDEGNSPMFPCLGSKDCPGCMIGSDPRFRALLPVMVKGDPEQKILSMGIALFRTFIDIDTAVTGGIKGAVIRVSRRGNGLSTKYAAVFTGNRAKTVPALTLNMLEHIGPMNREDIIAALTLVNKWPLAKGTAPVSSGGAPAVGANGAAFTDAETGGNWNDMEFETAEDDT